MQAARYPASARRWRDEIELAEWINARARMGKQVTLTPETAGIVAGHLRKAGAKPSRDDVALMICKMGEARRCTAPCYECIGRANAVVRAYGCSIDKRPG